MNIIKDCILLQQGETCALRRLGAAEAFRRLYPELTVNSWNEAFVSRTCDLLSELVGELPVYEYRCTADEAAVQVLREALWREDD